MTEETKRISKFILIKVSSGGIWGGMDSDHLMLRKTGFQELVGKLEGEENNIYKYDIKIKIPDTYHFQIQDKDYWYSKNYPPHLMSPIGYHYSYYILETRCIERFCNYIVKWVGSGLNEIMESNLIENLQALQFGYINDLDFVEQVLNTPTKDWSSLYINKILNGTI